MSNLKNKKNEVKNSYFSISMLGKSYKLNINYFSDKKVRILEGSNEINIFIPSNLKDKNNMEIVNIAIKKLYEQVAKREIENAMELARHILTFSPEDYLIKRINDGFCKTNKNVIVINPDIVQYSREIINQTILQAFCKSKYRTNSNQYKELIKYAINKYENYTRKISKVS